MSELGRELVTLITVNSADTHFDLPGDDPSNLEPIHRHLSPADMELGQQLLDELLTPLAPGEPRRHHYIPRFFLQRFAKDDMLIRVLADEPEERTLINTRHLAVVTDLYTTVIDDVGESVVVEKLLAVSDGLAVGPIRRLAIGSSLPPQEEDREILAMWLALLYVRGPKTRRMLEVIGEFTSKLELQSQFLAHAQEGASTTDRDWDLADARAWIDDVNVVRHQNDYIRLIADLWQRIAPVIQGRRWTLFKYSEPGVLLPDNPMVVTGPESERGVGIVNADRIYVPLDRRTVLALHNDTLMEQTIIRDAGDLTIDDMNQILVQQLANELYCHPDDVDRITALTLPSPNAYPLMDVIGGDWTTNVDGVNQPPTRTGPRRYRDYRGQQS